METANGFISTFMNTISNCSLYSREHISVHELTRKALSILNELLTESDSLQIMIVDHDLIINKARSKSAGLHGTNLIRRLKRKGFSRVDFLRGVTFSEMKQFVVDLSEIGEELKTYPHIKTGVVDVRMGKPNIDIDSDVKSLSPVISDQVDMVKEVHHDISHFKKLNLAGLEEIVINFIISFRREANILKLLSPVKSYSEYTYTHATNVAVLTMFQAEILGLRDNLLRDIGIAALLHDVGKFFISKDILEKPGALDEKEWEEIKLHPIYGAQYLTKIDGLTRLAPIVAFEHHLRYDGQGYPKLNVNNKKKQHLCSQIVAISDFFDALRSKRPYRRALEIEEVISLMEKDAETGFNPFLLDNFIGALKKALFE